MSGYLYSERTAYALMSPRRQAIHRLLHRVYYALPYPYTPLVGRMWRRYRRTWPR